MSARARSRPAVLAWLALLVAVPLGAALALHALNDYAEGRRAVALHLETLGNDVNQVTADVGWALAIRTPASTAGPRIDAGRGRVAADVAALATDGAGGATAGIAQQTYTYMTTLGDATVLLGTGVDTSSAVERDAEARAGSQHRALLAMVRSDIATATHEADAAEAVTEAGTWATVIVLTAAVALVVRRAQAGRRRAAAAQHAALAERERAFRMLFERNPLPMWTLDACTLRFLAVNDAALSAYGYSASEFLEMTVLDLRPRDASSRPTSWLRGAGALAGNDRHVLKDGAVIDVDVVAEETEVGDCPMLLMAARDITDQRRLEAELRRRAFHDSLTGLANRSLFSDRFAHAQKARRGPGGGLAVVLVDLDGFKVVNDSLSHSVGDRVLRTVAARLQTVVRAQDTVARMGGDEFAVLLEEADAEAATAVGTRLLEVLREPVDAGGRTVDVTASAGLALVRDSAVTWDTALQQADIAMYAAKAQGKACLRVYEPGMQSAVLSRLEISADLHGACGRGELVLLYQPIVATGDPSGCVERVEALVRWDHPRRGRLAPACFIPLAEETGVIVEVGGWILAEACRQAAAWRGGGHEVSVSVNVSARQLREEDFVASVTDALRDAALPATALVLEITETALLEDAEDTARKLDRLRGRGVRVAIDDFGAGHSSLNRLAELPVDEVKIDRALVSGIENTERRAMVLTVVRLLETMGVTTVAEGVETPAQLAYVGSLGVDAYQGFLFSPPLAASELHDLLRRSLDEVGAATA